MFVAADINKNGVVTSTEFRQAFSLALPGIDPPRSTASPRLRSGKARHNVYSHRAAGKQMWDYLHQDEGVAFKDMTPRAKQEFRDRSRIRNALQRHAPQLKHRFQSREMRDGEIVTHTRIPLKQAGDLLRKVGVSVTDQRVAELYKSATGPGDMITFSELAAHTDDFFRRLQSPSRAPKYGRRRVCWVLWAAVERDGSGAWATFGVGLTCGDVLRWSYFLSSLPAKITSQRRPGFTTSPRVRLAPPVPFNHLRRRARPPCSHKTPPLRVGGPNHPPPVPRCTVKLLRPARTFHHDSRSHPLRHHGQVVVGALDGRRFVPAA